VEAAVLKGQARSILAELSRESLAKTASSQEEDGFRMNRRAGDLASLVLVLALAEHKYVVGGPAQWHYYRVGVPEGNGRRANIPYNK
jgi:hypothetical protein